LWFNARLVNEDAEHVRESVAAACRRLAGAGLVLGTAGNVSQRIDAGRFAITGSGAVLADTERHQVSVVDSDGTILDGPKPSSELDLHLGVYDRFGAAAVVHTHAPMATALSCVLDEVPCVHYAMLAFGGSVRVAPYRTFGTSELAAVTLDALEGRTAALMANHGAIGYGGDLDGAVENALLLEWACGVYLHAAQVGTPRTLGERELQSVVEAVVARNYGTIQEAGS
jgi:L-fuculose-phosphate aldolase